MRIEFLVCLGLVAAAGMWGCERNTDPFGANPGTTMVPAMITIPAGTFRMGDTAVGMGPVHTVSLGAFAVSQTPITQQQYSNVMDSNPSYFNYDVIGDWTTTYPVESVTWYHAALFCNALSKLAGRDTVYVYAQGIIDSSVVINYTKNGYRLPTEAEYEYACRAGSTTDYYWGRNYPPATTADTLAIDSNAFWYPNSQNTTQPVATLKPNRWGLYDMCGNVWEWCNDWVGNYSSATATNPAGPATGSYRAIRGSSWANDDPELLCSSYRGANHPDSGFIDQGFRVVVGAR
jgi:formylglycine-generating enzyme required for sulfatase activity